jgi:hypothetical protein
MPQWILFSETVNMTIIARCLVGVATLIAASTAFAREEPSFKVPGWDFQSPPLTSRDQNLAEDVALILVAKRECHWPFKAWVEVEVREFDRNYPSEVLTWSTAFTKKVYDLGAEQFCNLAYTYIGDLIDLTPFDWTQGWGGANDINKLPNWQSPWNPDGDPLPSWNPDDSITRQYHEE